MWFKYTETTAEDTTYILMSGKRAKQLYYTQWYGTMSDKWKHLLPKEQEALDLLFLIDFAKSFEAVREGEGE
jgi:hypothetical protein